MIREIFGDLTVLPLVAGSLAGGLFMQLIGYDTGDVVGVSMAIAYCVFGLHKDVKWY